MIPLGHHGEPCSKGPACETLGGSLMIICLLIILCGCIHIGGHCRRRRRRRSNSLTSEEHQSISSTIASGFGLDLKVLESLPIFHYSVTSELASDGCVRIAADCTVCLAGFKESEKVRILPTCMHGFHAECIDMWFHSHSTCPLCRSVVKPVTFTTPIGNGARPAVASSSQVSSSSPSLVASSSGRVVGSVEVLQSQEFGCLEKPSEQ